MVDKIVGPVERQSTRKTEVDELGEPDERMLECNSILAETIDQMRYFAEREEILKALRYAIEVLDQDRD
jgi:hypothetical protein